MTAEEPQNLECLALEKNDLLIKDGDELNGGERREATYRFFRDSDEIGNYLSGAWNLADSW